MIDFSKLAKGTKIYIGQKEFIFEELDVVSGKVVFGNEWLSSDTPFTLRPYTIPAEYFEPPEPAFENGEKVMVSNDKQSWFKRYFSRYGGDGFYYCYSNPTDAWSNIQGEATGWNYVRKPTPQEFIFGVNLYQKNKGLE